MPSLLRHLLPLVGACLTLGACVECEQIDYRAPFRLDIAAAEGEVLSEGNYTLEILADEIEWRVECGSTTELEDEFDALICETSLSSGEAKGQSLAATLDHQRIQLIAQRYVDPDTLGIEQLEVRVLRDDMELALEQYAPTYEEHLSGPRACGVTELAPEQTLELPPA